MLFFVLAFAFSVLTSAVGTILIKIGSSKMPPIDLLSLKGLWAIMSNWYIFVGIILYGLSFPAYSFVLQKMNVSIAYPLFQGIGFATIVILSLLFLKETLTLWQFVGLLLILGGIVLLGTNGSAAK